MKYPNLNEEKNLWKQGYKFVIGLDESGRGPLAGPVVAAAVIISSPKIKTLNSKKIPKLKRVLDFGYSDFFRISDFGFKIYEVKDSKKMNKFKREKFYKIFTNHPRVKWGIGMVSERVIDKINIFNATKLAMRKAIQDLSYKIDGRRFYKNKMADFLLIDGNFALNNLNIPQKSIIGADEKVFSCVVAGIIAKVQRDKIMQKIHEKYPQYCFDQHKGYGTKLHMKILKKFGPCKIHRKTFYPVSAIVKNNFI